MYNKELIANTANKIIEEVDEHINNAQYTGKWTHQILN